MPRATRLAFLTATSLLFAAQALAAARMPALFSDGMVLQRQQPVAVWGWAEASETVTVRIAGQEKSAIADANGRWSLKLDPLQSGGPLEMTVSGNGNKIEIKDVLVGDVFQCSGQSNMAMSMDSCKRYAGTLEDIRTTKLPQVRLFQAPNATFAKTPQEDVQARWERIQPSNNAHFSAVAFYFARALHAHLKIPIGIVRASHGGGCAEIKMPADALRSVPCGQAFYENALKRSIPEAIEARNKLFRERYEEALKEAKAKGTKLPDPPKPVPEVDGGYPCSDWNGVIAPVIRYTKRAILWYQGEHNAGRAAEYRVIFPVLIRSWREASGREDLPFIFVQLPAYASPAKTDNWPLLRESQWFTLKQVPNTAMVVAIDRGEKDDIHPADKKPVAERLALETRRLVYGEAVSGCGPLLESSSVEGSSIVLRFKTNGGDLKSATGEQLKGFTIAGEDRTFVTAVAVIRGADTVVVSSPDLAQPKAVRYAWEGWPTVSLFNALDLPASPFRTDGWER